MSLSQIRTLVMLEQTLFGLPWAFIGALFPYIQGDQPFVLKTWILIVLAFTLARTAGMAFNRLIDKNIDALNPRTQNRPLQTGLITVKQVSAIASVSLVGFVTTCYFINPLCFLLSFIPAGLIVFYSFTKRFTAFCHAILGATEFFAPFLAWIAVKGTIELPPILLGTAMCLWLTGMDIFYSLQDVTFDRQWRLCSAPVALGINQAILIAKIMHGLCVALLIITGLIVKASLIYFMGTIIVAAIFQYQHKMICPQKPQNIQKIFFLCNGWIAMTLLVFTLGEVLWRASS